MFVFRDASTSLRFDEFNDVVIKLSWSALNIIYYNHIHTVLNTQSRYCESVLVSQLVKNQRLKKSCFIKYFSLK